MWAAAVTDVPGEWDRHAGHREAIAAASAGTRAIISAAGGIMIAVFLGFAGRSARAALAAGPGIPIT